MESQHFETIIIIYCPKHILDSPIAEAVKSLNGLDIPTVLAKMKKMNEDQLVRNVDLFGPVNNNTLTIVIQVHNRLKYLKHLIVSLSKVGWPIKFFFVF